MPTVNFSQVYTPGLSIKSPITVSSFEDAIADFEDHWGHKANVFFANRKILNRYRMRYPFKECHECRMDEGKFAFNRLGRMMVRHYLIEPHSEKGLEEVY